MPIGFLSDAERERLDGFPAQISPARYEHINLYGKYRFEIEEGLSRSRLRPLRQPTEQKPR